MSEQATSTQIAEFNQTESALAVLREKCVPENHDFTTKQGYEDGKIVIRELVTLRTSLDKKRLELNADDQARIKFRNAEAKRITNELVNLEQPLKDAKSLIDDRAERAKREAQEREDKRLAAIEFRIKEMGAGMLCHAGMSMESLEENMKAIGLGDFDFMEYREAAEAECERVRTHIQQAIHDRRTFELEREKIEADKKKRLAEEERLQEERDKLAAEQKAEDDRQAEDRRKLAEERQQLEDEKQARIIQEAARSKAIRDKEERQEAIKQQEAAQEAHEKRMKALRPDKEKLKDYFAKVRFLDAPAGIKSKEAKKMAAEFMADLDNLATNYITGLEDL